jgi:hypothetical protein
MAGFEERIYLTVFLKFFFCQKEIVEILLGHISFYFERSHTLLTDFNKISQHQI